MAWRAVCVGLVLTGSCNALDNIDSASTQSSSRGQSFGASKTEYAHPTASADNLTLTVNSTLQQSNVSRDDIDITCRYDSEITVPVAADCYAMLDELPRFWSEPVQFYSPRPDEPPGMFGVDVPLRLDIGKCAFMLASREHTKQTLTLMDYKDTIRETIEKCVENAKTGRGGLFFIGDPKLGYFLLVSGSHEKQSNLTLLDMSTESNVSSLGTITSAENMAANQTDSLAIALSNTNQSSSSTPSSELATVGPIKCRAKAGPVIPDLEDCLIALRHLPNWWSKPVTFHWDEQERRPGESFLLLPFEMAVDTCSVKLSAYSRQEQVLTLSDYTETISMLITHCVGNAKPEFSNGGFFSLGDKSKLYYIEVSGFETYRMVQDNVTPLQSNISASAGSELSTATSSASRRDMNVTNGSNIEVTCSDAHGLRIPVLDDCEFLLDNFPDHWQDSMTYYWEKPGAKPPSPNPVAMPAQITYRSCSMTLLSKRTDEVSQTLRLSDYVEELNQVIQSCIISSPKLGLGGFVDVGTPDKQFFLSILGTPDTRIRCLPGFSQINAADCTDALDKLRARPYWDTQVSYSRQPPFSQRVIQLPVTAASGTCGIRLFTGKPVVKKSLTLSEYRNLILDIVAICLAPGASSAGGYVPFGETSDGFFWQITGAAALTIDSGNDTADVLTMGGIDGVALPASDNITALHQSADANTTLSSATSRRRDVEGTPLLAENQGQHENESASSNLTLTTDADADCYYPGSDYEEVDESDCMKAAAHLISFPYWNRRMTYSHTVNPRGPGQAEVPVFSIIRSCIISFSTEKMDAKGSFVLSQSFSTVELIMRKCVKARKPGYRRGGISPVGDAEAGFSWVIRSTGFRSANDSTVSSWQADAAANATLTEDSIASISNITSLSDSSGNSTCLSATNDKRNIAKAEDCMAALHGMSLGSTIFNTRTNYSYHADPTYSDQSTLPVIITHETCEIVWDTTDHDRYGYFILSELIPNAMPLVTNCINGSSTGQSNGGFMPQGALADGFGWTIQGTNISEYNSTRANDALGNTTASVREFMTEAMNMTVIAQPASGQADPIPVIQEIGNAPIANLSLNSGSVLAHGLNGNASTGTVETS